MTGAQEATTMRSTRNSRPFSVATLLLALAGCGGGSGGGADEPGTPAAFAGGGTLLVTVRDVFGAPVVGAQVSVTEQSSPRPIPAVVTDGSGKARITGVPNGPFALEARTNGGFGYLRNALSNHQSMVIDMIMHPASQDAGGVVRAWVTEGGLSEDGRTLEFKLELSDVPGKTRIYSYYSDWADEDADPWQSVMIEACQPSPANDPIEPFSDCVTGVAGFDAPYAGTPSAAPLDLQRLPEPTPFWSPLGDPLMVPFRTILLLDQSAYAAADDGGQQRLLAAKYFLNYASEHTFSAMLGGFAADEPTVAAGLALLPQKPLTMFPVENPVFTADGRSYFTAIDGLRALEGGAPSLFAAIDRAIDLQVSAGGTVPRSVVVITDGGHDFTCGSRAVCRAARDAVIEKSRDTGVAIVAVGYNGWYEPDWETLALLGQGAPGSATFLAGDSSGLAPTLRTVRKYLAQMKRTAIATFRIASPTPGAFASGRTVLGWVSYGGGCAFECGDLNPPGTAIPFAVTIP
jgi:Carboxypeptidase regulatory-like domain/von Willebrand factor type A domain